MRRRLRPAGLGTLPPRLAGPQRTELEGLAPEGRAALLPLGEVLGRYEAQGQREAIAQARAALDRERERAEGEKLRMGRVYQALGLSGGAFLVILLL